MRILLIYCFVLTGLLSGGVACHGAEKWLGVDEAVVKKIAREHGREEVVSLIPAPEGDMQLFMFLMAGAAGGFAAGYYWRALLEGKKRKDDGPTG